MEKFEYKTLVANTAKTEILEYEKQINELGKEGWELVSTVAQAENLGATICIISIFKRKI